MRALWMIGDVHAAASVVTEPAPSSGQDSRRVQRTRPRLRGRRFASLRSLIVASHDAGKPLNGLQLFITALAVLMASWQATAFLIGEYSSASDENPVSTVADGLIWLRQSVQGNSVVRKMESMKMRGQPTLPGPHTFHITSAGLNVFAPPNLVSQTGEKTVNAVNRRLSMGVPGLDAILGGGLPCGNSLLVAGPSGSGKGITAAAFLAEGARLGETDVIAAFEQRPKR